MEPRTRMFIAVLAALCLGLGAFSAGFLVGGEQTEAELFGDTHGSQSALGAIRDAYSKILSTAVDPPSEQALKRAAIKAMIKAARDAGDPYAAYYTPQGYMRFSELTSGQFSGIGVWLKQSGDLLEIVSVLPASPARAAGLKRGDVITSIDGRTVEVPNIDEAVVRIKGPEGTEVSLGIERGGDDLAFTITRATLELPNLQARLTDEGLGYIRLIGFARGAGDQVRDKVADLTEDGATGIILDLRDNGGGLFNEAIDVASVFIEDGVIVTYEERSDSPVTYDAVGDAFEKLPLVVLVNEGTASASEIVAGAFQDRERAVLIGVTTYGKGSVQEVLRLEDSSAIKLTIGAYLTPGGTQINGVGIEPDVVVADKDAVKEARLQRARAIEILQGIVLSTAGAQG